MCLLSKNLTAIITITTPTDAQAQRKTLFNSIFAHPDAVVSPQHTEEQLQLLDCDAVTGHDPQHVH